MATQSLERLFSPFSLGDLSLPNRVVMAPLTRSRAAPGDVPTPLMAEYYGQRATAGLIITEASQVSAQGKGYPRTPGCYSPAQEAGWSEVTRTVHDKGGRMFLQLWHVGRLSHPDVQPDGGLPVAPSAIAAQGEIYTEAGLKTLVVPRALETDEIPGLIEAYRQAARNALKAGFDGVEVHGANGYLIDQFLRDGSNQRTDAYGGSVENRIRFLIEVVEAVVEVMGPKRVGVRLSPVFEVFSMKDSDPAATFGAAASALSRYGLAYLHVVELGEQPLDFAALKKAFGGPYIAAGGYDAAKAEAALASGRADLVAFGTHYIANPDLVERFRRGAPLATPNPETFFQGEEKGYTDYPVLA
ncbi:alkene reductase [Pararhodospirillum oryzae]|uniref:Alkene reductase n=1 Tax=Pararhodospirillum oryzae TaxID=478448 RepID=A0A512H627_9PROT|nr:alkene reductase [Pararhodospirillum oryzae]GEO80925.1 alkene reductase [Pararhodospirillum oryzae]